MLNDYCPQCGHLLPNNRPDCTYCSWEADTLRSERFMDPEDQSLLYLPDLDVFSPEQLPSL